MKAISLYFASVLMTALSAQGALYQFTSSVNQAIPDGNPTGLSSSITVSGLEGLTIQDVNVDLNISGGFNGDLYGYLSLGDYTVILLNRVGRTSTDPFGYADAGMLVRLDDQAAADIHQYGGNNGSAITGTWQPDGRTTNPQWVLDTDPRNSSLGTFNTLNPNGTWTVFFADMAGGESTTSTLVEWSLEINAVPEPVTVSLGIFGAIAGLYAVRRQIIRWKSSRC